MTIITFETFLVKFYAQISCIAHHVHKWIHWRKLTIGCSWSCAILVLIFQLNFIQLFRAITNWFLIIVKLLLTSRIHSTDRLEIYIQINQTCEFQIQLRFKTWIVKLTRLVEIRLKLFSRIATGSNFTFPSITNAGLYCLSRFFWTKFVNIFVNRVKMDFRFWGPVKIEIIYRTVLDNLAEPFVCAISRRVIEMEVRLCWLNALLNSSNHLFC